MALLSVTPNRQNHNVNMKIMLLLALFVGLLLASKGSYGQVGAQLSELKGFKYWQWESFTDKLDKTFVVRRLYGTITRAVGDRTPLNGVYIQLREFKQTSVIRTTQTSANGTFHLAPVPPGKYMIKIAARGFSTWIGEVIVSSKADDRKALDVAMIPGS
jgi:hypothetical protein